MEPIFVDIRLNEKTSQYYYHSYRENDRISTPQKCFTIPMFVSFDEGVIQFMNEDAFLKGNFMIPLMKSEEEKCTLD